MQTITTISLISPVGLRTRATLAAGWSSVVNSSPPYLVGIELALRLIFAGGGHRYPGWSSARIAREGGEMLWRYRTTACQNCPLQRNAQPGQSGGIRDGSTSICPWLCSSASMQTRKPCVSVARQSSIRSAG